MTAQLIYHTPESMAGGVSPFDIAISEMVENEDLRIASPYIGLSYLQRMIERSRNWRLLTDVQEWLLSNAAGSRGQIADFIVSNADRVRHCKDLHAKVLIGQSRALTGSANFTDKGITRRVEVSVLFDGCEQVDELRAWFDFLWERTAQVAEADLRACIATMPPPASLAANSQLTCAFPGVAAKLREVAAAVGGSADAEAKLMECLRQAPDRRWAESYLEMARELVETTGLREDDRRLVMSLPQGSFLPITINRRYVLAAFRIDEGKGKKHWLLPDYTNPPGHAVVELILPFTMKDRIDALPGAIRHGSFGPGFSGETEDGVPRFVSFSRPSDFGFSPDVLEAWKEALQAECNHQRASGFRKYHEPVVYQAVVDLHYRQRLLDRIFGI